MRKPLIGMPRLLLVLSLALAGLMALQVMLLRYAWELKDQALQSGARTALASAVLALQSREIEGSAFDYFFAQDDSSRAGGSGGPATVWTSNHSYTVTHTDDPAAPDGTTVPRVLHEGNQRRFRTVQRDLRRLEGGSRVEPGLGEGTFSGDSLVVMIAPQVGRRGDVLAVQSAPDVTLRHVVGEWISRAPQPIGERLDADEVAAVLREELAAVGIGAEPAFGVVKPSGLQRLARFPGRAGGPSFVPAVGPAVGPDRGDDRPDIVLASDNITDAELHDSDYRQEMFPLDPFGAPYELVLAFPRDRLYLLKQIGPLWLASVVFITVIIFSIVKAWRTNAEQRRFGGQLVDFINNMTHEFKTPISTVALAGEAMTRADVRSEPEVIERYVGMIRDENARMHRQVEKILQMARFERGDIDMKHEPVDVHDVISGVAESFALQVERRGGRLDLALEAGTAVVEGDRVHLESIIGNLVDNAVKYSPGEPAVRVSTALQDRWLEIRVTDQGPGIPRDEQRRVFEKYYRCPTGDRHDVKGFGLGLSFVRSLVHAHGGHVELHSLSGRGTTVIVSLPLLPVSAEPAEAKA